jgi:hypothetical protein
MGGEEEEALIRRHLEKHVLELHRVIQRFHTGGHPGGC